MENDNLLIDAKTAERLRGWLEDQIAIHQRLKKNVIENDFRRGWHEGAIQTLVNLDDLITSWRGEDHHELDSDNGA